MKDDSPPTRGRRLGAHLWMWAFAALLSAWVTLAFVAYQTGLHEADEISDGLLQSVARVLLQQPAPQVGPDALADAVATLPLSHPDDSYAPQLRVLMWMGDQLVWDSHIGEAPIRRDMPTGYHTVRLALVAHPVQDWRMLVADAEHPALPTRRVAVLVSKGRRQALARDIAEHIVRPALIVLPLLALLLAWAIRRGLLPLRRLSRDIAVLDVQGGQTLKAGQPFHELEVMVNAINTLVERLSQQVERERRFASDVAHELRTPITSLLWQARAAMAEEDRQVRAAALTRVQQDALRAGHILTQLLDLARAQRPGGEAAGPVDLVQLARDAVTGHAALAHERGQDLALQAPSLPVLARGHATLAALALRNLVDNALRHNPPGTQVEVRVETDTDGDVLLSVSDNGPRAAALAATDGLGVGLGLGLGLVERLAAAQGAALSSDDGQAPFTRRYRLEWPVWREPAG